MSQSNKSPRTNNILSTLSTLIILALLVLLIILVIIYNKKAAFTNNNNNNIEKYSNIPIPSITKLEKATETTAPTPPDTIYNRDLKFYKKYPYFDCYLKLLDVNPKLVNEYMKYDKQYITNGNCKNATLHMTVEPCPTNTNGAPLTAQCSETAILTSSKGNPQMFTYSITPQNISKFFGIKL